MSIKADMPPEYAVLGPEDVVPERPFTATELTEQDRRVVGKLLSDLRDFLHDVDAGTRKAAQYHRFAWQVDGLTHRLLICDEKRLRAHQELCVVGFFGDRRSEVDIAPLEKANMAIVAEFEKYPGILSYSSMELAGGHWANMVLHDDPVDTEFWRKSKLHQHAVAFLSPQHYKSVRLHNGRLTAGLFDDPEIIIKKTKYLDFQGESEWRAERTLIE
jgi:hypothetical protein